jgi:protein TonB
MSSVALSPRLALHPDAKRIAAQSAVIAIHLAVLVALLRPITPELAATARQLTEPVVVTWVPKPPEPVAPPPPVHLKPLPVSRPAPVVSHPAPMLPAPAPVGEARANSVPVTAPPAAPTTPAMPAAAAPVEATLAYVAAPAPAYPAAARRMQMEGTVTLRVLVDTDGNPLDVIVATTSGHPELDRAARLQVLARWRFQPAQRDGHQVQAWALIPITFNLTRL